MPAGGTPIALHASFTASIVGPSVTLIQVCSSDQADHSMTRSFTASGNQITFRPMARDLATALGYDRVMKSGMWNLAFGLVGVVAGLSGQFALPGTQSPMPLVAVGGVVAAFGLIQIVRAARQGR
jgi:hypothetical protein